MDPRVKYITIYNNFVVYVNISVQYVQETGRIYCKKLLWHLTDLSDNHEKYSRFSISVYPNVCASNKEEKFARQYYTVKTLKRKNKKTTHKIFGVEM